MMRRQKSEIRSQKKRMINWSIAFHFFRVHFSFLFVFLLSSLSFALEIPSTPTARVNDYAHLLDSSSHFELESKLKTFEEVTSTQLVVVTFPSLDGESLEDFSIRLAEKWKIGQKGKDNGAILLIFKNDHKLRIEVGYGLEGALPDATTKMIIENEIVPHFKNGDFKRGIFAGVDAMISATQGEYKASPQKNGQSWVDSLVLILFLGFWGFGFFGIVFYKIIRGVTGNTIG